ncbi:uncharacterized protein BO95DRAFT_326018, partial [Aspergillus brunneoviolaceus CBS 621.78]
LHRTHVTGAIPFLNPTHAAYRTTTSSSSSSLSSTGPTHPQIYRLWRSRDTRKGRHALRISTTTTHDAEPRKHHHFPVPLITTTQPPTTHPRIILATLKSMLTTFPYWDLSYLIAVTFTLGSAIWIVNAFFVWLPLQDPGTVFRGEEGAGGGWTAFVGAAVFEVGSWGLVVEAWGYTTKAISNLVLRPSTETCTCHHSNRKGLLSSSSSSGRKKAATATALAGSSAGAAATTTNTSASRPQRTSKRVNHYLHDLGLLASLAQLVGATIFWIAGFTGLPGILGHMSPPLTDGVYWVPQVVGGVCFVVSGGLFTLETQERWDRPAWRVLGWHIGVWNLVGGVGFTLCGVFGLVGMQYQACLATFWGSWAFLWASGLQWYESLEKWPVEME